MFLYNKEMFEEIELRLLDGVDPRHIIGILMDKFQISPEEAKTVIWEYARDKLNGEAKSDQEGSN